LWRAALEVVARYTTQLNAEACMLRWAFIFFIVAIVAAALGFTGISVAAAGVARFLFYIFVVLCILALVGGLAIGKKVSS